MDKLKPIQDASAQAKREADKTRESCILATAQKRELMYHQLTEIGHKRQEASAKIENLETILDCSRQFDIYKGTDRAIPPAVLAA
jgi:hypothetical protein